MRGYAAIALYNPKNNINIGSALRAAGCYGASMVVCGGSRRAYRKAPTDTMASHKHLPLLLVDELRSVIPYDCVPVAIDLLEGATPLQDYKHPERAFYVFGPEDGTLGARTLEWCRDKVYVPTNGCMNLAACVNVILWDRMSKQLRRAV